MKLYKFVLAIGLWIAISLSASAQTSYYKYLATEFSVQERDRKGNWGAWSDFQPAKIAVVFDPGKDRIVVYSQEVQVYAILNYEKVRETEDDIIYPFSCTDDDGRPFTLSIITRKKQGNRQQLYINQKDFIIVYNLEKYPEPSTEKKK